MLDHLTYFTNLLACRSVRSQLEVSIQVVELQEILPPASVDVRQNKISRGETGLAQQRFADGLLGLLAAPAKDSTQGEVRCGVAPAAEINRFLKSFRGLLILAKPQLRYTRVVIRFVVVRKGSDSPGEL